MHDVSKFLRHLREGKGWSLSALAHRLEVSRQAVAKWENGNTENLKLENLRRLCTLYRITPDEILWGEKKITAYRLQEQPDEPPCAQDHADFQSADKKYMRVFPKDIEDSYLQLPESGKQYVLGALRPTIRTAQEIHGTLPKQTAA